jgi:hypothetical protein
MYSTLFNPKEPAYKRPIRADALGFRDPGSKKVTRGKNNKLI